MVNIALKLMVAPALLLTAVPASSAVMLVTNGWTVPTATNPFAPGTANGSLWYLKPGEAGQQIFLTFDLVHLAAGFTKPPAALVSILPEPMSWALMVVGLATVGWSIRSLQRRENYRISFV